MPKIVDHNERREELAEAAWNLISKDGIEGASVRAVAEQAGCSTGALVHYFGDKNSILVAALRYASRRTADRMARRLSGKTGLGGLRGVLEESLPLDTERRNEWRIWLSFWGRAAGDERLAAEQKRRYDDWRALVRDILEQAKSSGDLAATLDATREADALVALIDGVGIQASFEPERLPATQQLEIVDRYLERLAIRSREPQL